MPVELAVAMVALGTAGVALVVGAHVFHAGFFLRRRVRGLPLHTIAQTPAGTDVRVCGRVVRQQDQPVLEAPLSGKRCAAYHVVWEERHGTSRGGRWVRMGEEQRATHFTLVDATGRADVDGRSLTLMLDPNHHAGAGVLRFGDARLDAFLAAHAPALLHRPNVRVRESVLEFDHAVAVVGAGQWAPGHERAPSGDREATQVLRLGAASDGRLIVTDDPLAR